MTSTADQHFFTVVSIANIKGERFVTTSLIAHIEGDYVIIEHDINNKPLADALTQAGIARERIILVYAGETLPEKV